MISKMQKLCKIMLKHIRIAAFEYLTTKQVSHSKVNTIKYTKQETQKYMVSPIFLNEEVNQLHALRSRTTNCKMNFKNKYRNDDPEHHRTGAGEGCYCSSVYLGLKNKNK